jgi:hypothetical protein
MFAPYHVKLTLDVTSFPGRYAHRVTETVLNTLYEIGVSNGILEQSVHTHHITPNRSDTVVSIAHLTFRW